MLIRDVLTCSCGRYLETKALVQQFKGSQEAQTLQRQLFMHSIFTSNWLTTMWEQCAYRMARGSLAYSSNYVVLQPPTGGEKEGHLLRGSLSLQP